MPFIDLNKEDISADKVYDVTIIGAGAAGILLAVKLSEQGKSVLLIESGHFSIDEERQKLNNVTSTAKTLENAVWGRKRAVGGTTLAWGGQSLPFSSFDFEKKNWVENSGWPISYDVLAGYYKEANRFMKIDALDYREDILPKIELKDPGFDNRMINYHVSKWANEPNFFKLYQKVLEEKVTVVYNAVLTKINTVGQNASSIKVSNFDKKHFQLDVKQLIIATGGIESIRIVLLNQLSTSKWAGKCFMDHPCLDIGTVDTTDSYRLQRYFNTHVWDGRKYSIRMSISDELQQKQQLLNCSALLLFNRSKDTFDLYSEIYQFRRDKKPSRFLKILGKSPMLIKGLVAYLRHKFYYKINALPLLCMMVEQEPSTESYISLSDERDIFNLPKANINWTISKKTWDTVIAVTETLKAELAKMGFGKLEVFDDIRSNNPNWLDLLHDVNHHMGGLRMSATANDGVVDNELKLWSYNNIHVCSCAVFPTSSHSNPTLTMLALACRLVDKLTSEK